MRNIYSKDSVLVVWLGKVYDSSDSAVNFVNRSTSDSGPASAGYIIAIHDNPYDAEERELFRP